MGEHFGEQLKQRLLSEKITTGKRCKGCTEEQIQKMLVSQNIKRLPKTFLQYLEVLGNGGLDVHYVGADWWCDVIPGMKEDIIHNIKNYGEGVTLPDDAFVFFNHHDVVFRYFLTDNHDDNPPVYQYIESSGQPKQIADSVTQYFDLLIRRLIWE